MKRVMLLYVTWLTATLDANHQQSWWIALFERNTSAKVHRHELLSWFEYSVFKWINSTESQSIERRNKSQYSSDWNLKQGEKNTMKTNHRKSITIRIPELLCLMPLRCWMCRWQSNPDNFHLQTTHIRSNKARKSSQFTFAQGRGVPELGDKPNILEVFMLKGTSPSDSSARIQREHFL